jgi:hypothetical protein
MHNQSIPPETVATAPEAKILYVVTCLLALAVFAAVIISFAGLIPLGYWHSDEFVTFATMRDSGIRFFINRIMQWSPRPLSELFVLAYERAVQITQRPLITSVLSIIWLALFACVGLTPAFFFKKYAWQEKFSVLMLALALMSAFLLGHPVSEVFYWPMAALPYIPTLAAICVLLWSVCAGQLVTKRGQITCSVSLIVAATCSEMGAMFVCAFVMLTVFGRLTSRIVEKSDHRKDSGTRVFQVWMIFPLACSAWVLYMMATGRAQSTTELLGSGEASLRHYLAKSLLAAGPAFVREVLSLGTHVTTGLLTKCFFFIGSFLTLSTILQGTSKRTNGYYLIGIAIACMATSFMTIAAAFYQFGMICCERHYTMRECLIFVSLVAASGSIAAFRADVKRSDRWQAAALVCLTIATAIPAYDAIPKLASDYMSSESIKGVRIKNWLAGTEQGISMVYLDQPPGEIVGGMSGLTGTYRMSPDLPEGTRGFMRFFNKESITFAPANEDVKLTNVTFLARWANNLSKFEASSGEGEAALAHSTSCSIDLVDLQPAAGHRVSPSNVVTFSGWALMDAPKRLPDSVFLSMQREGQTFVVRARLHYPRPDVPAALGIPASLDNAGFNVKADLSDLPDGQYELSVLSIQGTTNQICGRVPLTVQR